VQRLLSAVTRPHRGHTPDGGRSPTQRVPVWALAVAGFAGLLYLSLASHVPVAVLANASFDDGWFYQHARSLLAGHWLGHYSQMTLVKGPGYVFFLAANAVLGAPVTLTQAVLYVFACALFARMVFRLSRSAWLGLAVYIAVLLQPALVPLRLTRDDIYPAQTLIYLACLAQALFLHGSPRERGVWTLGAGLALAWFWITREEGVWIVPASLLLCGVAVWRELDRWRSVAGMAVTAVGALALLAFCNFAAYGAFTIVDLKGAAFSRAISAVQSVRVGEPTPYVPVPARVRERLYAESPAFSELRPYFEGPGRGWMEPGCQLYPTTCGDFAGGWFIWAFRDAVGSAGHYASPAEADRYYRRLADEIHAACAAGRLSCARGLVTLMPGVTASQWRQAPSELGGLAGLLSYRHPGVSVVESTGDPDEIRDMWRLEGTPLRTPTASERFRGLAGWFYAPPPVWIQLRCSEGGETVIPIERNRSLDIAVHFNDPTASNNRFRITLPPQKSCRLQLEGAGPQDPGLSFDYLSTKRDAPLAGHPLYIDSFGTAGTDPTEVLAIRILVGLERGLGALAPILCAAAALAYVVQLVRLARRSVRPDPCWWLCHALWLLVATRLAVLVLVDLSSFPAISALYLSAAFPLFWAALALTIAMPLTSRPKP
jgi:hypothetical protein